MMRKRSIISLLLAFCLCFSMITTAMAAEVNAEAQIEAQAVSRLADFDFVQSADVNEATFSIDGESVLVQNLSETTTLDEISKAELADAIESVASAVEEEFDSDTDIFNYYYITEDKVYVYETAADYIIDYNSTLSICDMDKEYAENLTKQMSMLEAELNSMENTSSSGEDYSSVIPIEETMTRLDAGVAARLKINNSAISYMQASVKLPTIKEMSGVNNTTATNYIYIGFSDNEETDKIQSDMGLQSGRRYTTETVPCGFKPYFRLYNKDKTYTTFNEEDFVYTPNHNLWFYLPSSSSENRETIKFELYKNANGQNIVRGNVYGLGVYGTDETQAWIKTTMDVPNIKSYELAPITYWKAVNTLTPKKGSTYIPAGTKSQCVFNNFLINGKKVSLSICKAQIYNKRNKDYGFVASTASGSYLDTVTFNLRPNW